VSNFVWDDRFPADKQFSWYNVTTWAERDWNAALKEYWSSYKNDYDTDRFDSAKRTLAIAREDYRRRVLSWYRKLCLPMEPGDCVPTRVAELLAEEWDEATRSKPSP
jgi:hypothetical protein